MVRFPSPSFPFRITMPGFIKPLRRLFFSHWVECDPSWYGGEPPSAVWMIKAASLRMAKPQDGRSLCPRHCQAILKTLDFTCLSHYMLGSSDTAVCVTGIPVNTDRMRCMSRVRIIHEVIAVQCFICTNTFFLRNTHLPWLSMTCPRLRLDQSFSVSLLFSFPIFPFFLDCSLSTIITFIQV